MPGAMGAAMARKRARDKQEKAASAAAAPPPKATAARTSSVNGDGGMPHNGGGGRVHPADMGPPPGGPPVDAKALANKMKSRKTALKFLNELMLYLIWTMCFTATIMLTRDNTQNHQFNSLFKNYVLQNEGWEDNLKTVDDFWDFISDITFKVLGQDIFTTAGDDFSSAETGFLYGNRRMGPVRIRQVRVPSKACSDVYFRNILGTEDTGLTKCYGEFSPTLTLENSFQKEAPDFSPDLDAQPWFRLRDKTELQEMAFFSAAYATYPGAGYVVDVENAHIKNGQVVLETKPFPDDKLQSLNVTVGELKNSRWIDLKTRAVFVDFSFFNPNLDTFLVARLAVEFLPSGIVGVYPTFRVVDPFKTFSTQTTMDLIVLGCYGVVFSLALVYFAKEMYSLFKLRLKFFKDSWSVMALLHSLIMLLVLYLMFMSFNEVNSLFGDTQTAVTQGKLQSLGYIVDQEKNLSGLAIIIMYLRLYKFCSVSRALSTLVRTLGKCAMSLLLFIFVYCISLAGMAVGCTLLFGADSYQFHSPSWSAFTLFRATFGDIDYTDWMSNRVLGPYLLIFWLLFSNAILFNIIVAIICDAFSNVIIENEEMDEKGIKSVIDIFLESGILGHRLSKMLSKKKQELGDIENALDLMDGDGDGLTDMGELEAWLKATGADKTLGITALEIMSKYDSDGSGQLDKEEMEEIKEWIRSEQEALKRAEAGEDDEDDGKGQSNAQIDAMMTMMSNLGGGGGGGGGYSAAMEERVLNIENKIGSLDGKLDKLMANLETIVANGGMGMGMGGSVAGAASRRGEQSVRGGSVYEAAGAKNVMQTGKMIASKALVSEEI